MSDGVDIDMANHALADFAQSADAWPAGRQQMGAHTSKIGLEAFTSRSEYAQRIEMTVCDSEERLHLSAWIRDGIDVAADDRRLRVEGGYSVAGYMPGVPWHVSFVGRVHHVGLMLRPALLECLAGEPGCEFFERLRRDGFFRAAQADPATLRTAHELDAALLARPANRLLCEAKSLELLARFIDAHRCDAVDGISRHDRERLLLARELLLGDLAQAPTLVELSRACGLNTLKLKRGFKLLFGLPAHALFQSERMAAAWRLIESGTMSVTEAGQHLGYSNLSHFGAAFKREYGLLPSELRRRTNPVLR
jgi:AraC family transcriptional regulator